MRGTIRRILKSTSEETLLKFYRVMALPTRLYVSENWTSTKSQSSCVQAAEMRFLWDVPGYILQDHKRSIDILQELNIMSILDIIAQYLSLIHI